MIGMVINRGASEIVVNISTVKYTGEMTVEFAGTSLNGISVESIASLETAITAYQPGGSGGDYSQGYADGEAAVATSQQPIASDYKSLLSGVDQTIAAADPTTLAGQMSIFNESYQYLSTGGGSGTPFTKDDFVKKFTPWSEYIWTDGTDMYYSNAGVNYVLGTTTSMWQRKVWNGYSSFYGYGIWTDGTNIYYSYGDNEQRVLDTATSRWRSKTWSVINVNEFYGGGVWTDGTNIYYSRDTYQYVLDVATSTWSVKTWSGLTNFRGDWIWTDGTNIYCSNGSDQYVLDVATSTWNPKTWTGLTSFGGSYIWTDGTNIYYSSVSGGQYVLDVATSTWTPKTWTGLTSFYGSYIWTDGTNIYYSYSYYGGSDQYVLDVATSTWTPKTWYEPYSIPSDIKLLSNRTVYSLDDIDMSYKPKSNNP